MIIIPIKWLFHWEYTLFSDKPILSWCVHPAWYLIFSITPNAWWPRNCKSCPCDVARNSTWGCHHIVTLQNSRDRLLLNLRISRRSCAGVLAECRKFKTIKDIPSGERLHINGKSPFLMGKSTISMVIFNSYVKLPEGKRHDKKMSYLRNNPGRFQLWNVSAPGRCRCDELRRFGILSRVHAWGPSVPSDVRHFFGDRWSVAYPKLQSWPAAPIVSQCFVTKSLRAHSERSKLCDDVQQRIFLRKFRKSRKAQHEKDRKCEELKCLWKQRMTSGEMIIYIAWLHQAKQLYQNWYSCWETRIDSSEFPYFRS